jgi:uncharacterized protein YbaP (TraB family)
LVLGCFVLTGVVPSAHAQENPLAAHPAWAGTFSDGKVTVTLTVEGVGFAGTVEVAGAAHPAHGSVRADGLLAGTFDVGGRAFGLEARLEGGVLVVSSGGTTYRLARRDRDEGNPLAGDPGAAPTGTPATEPDGPFLWVIEGARKRSYVYGAISIGDRRVRNLPRVVLDALAECQVFTPEGPMDDAAEEERIARLPDGSSLRGLLPAGVYRRLDDFLKGKGQPGAAGLDPFKVWVAWSLFEDLPAIAAGERSDLQVLLDQSKASGKEIGLSLGSLRENCREFDLLSVDDQVALLSRALDRAAAPDAPGGRQHVLSAWLRGDLDEVAGWLPNRVGPDPRLDTIARKVASAQGRLLGGRILQRVRDNPHRSYFFGVSAIWLGGEDGVLARLRSAGLTVRRAVGAQATTPSPSSVTPPAGSPEQASAAKVARIPERVVDLPGSGRLGVTIDTSLNDATFFPALHHLYGRRYGETSIDLCTVRLRDASGRGGGSVRVEVELEGLSRPASRTASVGAGGTTAVALTPTFLEDVARVVEQRAGWLRVVVEAGGRTLFEDRLPLTIASRNDMVVSSGMAPVFAVFVTPSDPAIDELVTEARRRTGDGVLAGYQRRDEADVQEQVRAVFDALAARGIGYRSATSTMLSTAEFFAQRVYFPGESIKVESANCIDGTVLMASVLERIELEPVIVFVPGHAFLGVRPAPGSERVLFIETTMIGTHSFEDAVAKATETFMAKRDVGLIIDIKTARRVGVLPFPFPTGR